MVKIELFTHFSSVLILPLIQYQLLHSRIDIINLHIRVNVVKEQFFGFNCFHILHTGVLLLLFVVVVVFFVFFSQNILKIFQNYFVFNSIFKGK
jgi:hypothetical protein